MSDTLTAEAIDERDEYGDYVVAQSAVVAQAKRVPELEAEVARLTAEVSGLHEDYEDVKEQRDRAEDEVRTLKALLFDKVEQ
jgi:cell division protein FtsB